MLQMPVIVVKGTTIPEVYENALLALKKDGILIKTQYDTENDPPSLDATANLTIESPMTDPMIHKCFPGGIQDLADYYIELLGNKNNWVRNTTDKYDKRWLYTYNQRLQHYGQFKIDNNVWLGENNDQFKYIVDELVKFPYSRRAQAITWIPSTDQNSEDPPCLQSICCRLVQDDTRYTLNTNIRFRSNDAYGAFFMNIFGITMLIDSKIRIPLNDELNGKVDFGRINWQADSFHIYGKNIKECYERLDKHTGIKTMNFYDEDIQDIWMEGLMDSCKKIKDYENR